MKFNWSATTGVAEKVLHGDYSDEELVGIQRLFVDNCRRVTELDSLSPKVTISDLKGKCVPNGARIHRHRQAEDIWGIIKYYLAKLTIAYQKMNKKRSKPSKKTSTAALRRYDQLRDRTQVLIRTMETCCQSNDV